MLQDAVRNGRADEVMMRLYRITTNDEVRICFHRNGGNMVYFATVYSPCMGILHFLFHKLHCLYTLIKCISV